MSAMADWSLARMGFKTAFMEWLRKTGGPNSSMREMEWKNTSPASRLGVSDVALEVVSSLGPGGGLATLLETGCI
jgi:hypothetical protein